MSQFVKSESTFFLSNKDVLKQAFNISPDGPLRGILVVEIGQHVSGPMLGERLARKGALVIKIEQPQYGDPARNYLLKEIFNSLNASKMSVVIGKDQQVLYLSILEMADVIIDNRSPEAKDNDKTLDTFLHSDKAHPVIFCSLIGYEGDDNKHLLALDVSVQAATGMAFINGAEPNKPLKVGFVILDEATAMEASDLIISHLFALSRGKKCRIENKNVIKLQVSMASVAAYLLTGQYLNYYTQENEPTRTGNRDNWLSPFSFYPTKNGMVSLAVINEEQYKRLCLNVLENAELLERFPTNAIRLKNINEFEEALNKILVEKESSVWLEKCQLHKVPASPINTVGQALKQSFFKNVITTTKPAAKEGISIIANPFTSSLYANEQLSRAPELNEHATAVDILVKSYKQLRMRNSSANFNHLHNQFITESETVENSFEMTMPEHM